ncbi:MAG TPA: polysaccharide deacetylase family protein [Alphaproteobacteria bacterium]|jgi:peptidoglycan/xylan/chitin deacetylase (PgdA/CDA1 family)|nr:polysaccharide deacetylase family protein [Alphaproteobacteria bacterium]MDP7164151.1 polysaccharide deacetylase family protein [Alphaproteobacteria bacterium]MDP7427756.1 polysaccharide deacetylase family protein [Alphaproteobacteria bacterium]HJM49619.1 polysaccharide deacetylase family protein [Alphaproteobacteria bacterium]
MSQRLLFVNYHYIRDPAQYAHPGIHPLAPADFAAQVDWLAGRYHMARPEEAEAFVRGQGTLPGPSVVLTLDDGMLDHHQAARQVLDRRGISAVFFISSKPLVERRAVMVHKIHWLRATMDPEAFRQAFMALLPERWRPGDDPGMAAAAARIYVYDSPDDGRLKYLINFVLPYDLMDEISSRLLAQRGLGEMEFCDDLYMNEAAVKELHQAGHCIGAHGHSHAPFTRLGDGLAADVEANIACLADICGQRPRWVSYPYGRDWAIPDDAGGFCRRFGFHIGLTLAVGWNEAGVAPFNLKRINTNEVAEVCDG